MLRLLLLFFAATAFAAPLSPEDSLKQLKVVGDFEISLVAAEPAIVDPVAMAWDVRGRLWVVEMRDYPLGMKDGDSGKNSGVPGARIVILTDTNGDGRFDGPADKRSVFIDELPYAKGVMPWRDGALITAAPDILFARDTNDDGVADKQEVVFSGFALGNQQLRVNGLRWGSDGWLYGCNGLTGGSKVKDASGKVVDLTRKDFRIRPDTREIEAQPGPSQFGRARDDAGNWFGVDNSNAVFHFPLSLELAARNPHVPSPALKRQLVTPRNPPVFPYSTLRKRIHADYMGNRFTSLCGLEIYRDNLLFPRSAVRHAFACEPVHNCVTHRVLHPTGPSFRAERPAAEKEREWFGSTDHWFRPVMVRNGPDGCLYVVDMYRDIVEHPHWVPASFRAEWQANSDLRAGHEHGRIYRIAPRSGGRQVTWPVTAEQQRHPNGTVRDLAEQQAFWADAYTPAPTRGPFEAVLNAAPKTLAAMPLLPDAYTRAAWAAALPGNLDGVVEIWSSSGPQDPQAFEAAVRTAKGSKKQDLMPALETIAFEAPEANRSELVLAFLRNAPNVPTDKSLKAIQSLADGEGATALELSALLLARAPKAVDAKAIRERFAKALGPGNPARQKTAIEALTKGSSDKAVAEMLLKSLPALYPDARQLAVDKLLRRADWTLALLKAVEAGRIPSAFDPAQQRRLVRSKNAEIKTRATALFGSDSTPRAEVVKKHLDVLEMAGDRTRGAAVYKTHCAICHHYGPDGGVPKVGPNLRAVTDRSPRGLLTAILDPAAAIEPRYLATTCTTRSGGTYIGVVADQTETSLTLQAVDGSSVQIATADIERLETTKLSLMPEGFESAFGKQDMADLLSYLGYKE